MDDKLQWQAPEYEERERDQNWFWALGVIVIATSLTAIIYGNYFFAVLVVLSGALLAFFAKRKPEIITYELSAKGLRMGRRFFPFENIAGFAVYAGARPLLLIKSDRFFIPIVSVTIVEEMAADIREIFLAKGINEENIKRFVN